MRTPRTRLRVTAAAALATTAMTLGCSRPDPPNVILVTIDTLRADALGSYGHAVDTTPFLDRLAAEGVRFERAYSDSSWTTPSMVSILTSLRPTVHSMQRATVSAKKRVLQQALPNDAVLWPELLDQAGYRTYGVTANELLAGRFGFDRGFDRYQCVGFGTVEQVEEVVRKWKDEISQSKPYFLWLHLLDPHAPYKLQPATKKLYGRKASSLKGLQTFAPWMSINQTPEQRRQLLPKLRPLYDGEVRHTDEAIERIFRSLEVSPADLVIVTSDHGEEMLEHGFFGHSVTLFEEVIHVPLIIRLPEKKRAGTVIRTPVRLTDILPTVLELARVDPPDHLQGRSLLPLIHGDESEPREIITSLSRRKLNTMETLTQGDWKYIHHETDPEHRGLFNLKDDPGERRNLLESEKERARAMGDRLRSVLDLDRSRRLRTRKKGLTAAEIERLRALGYLPGQER